MTDLLEQARKAGVSFYAVGEQLVVRGPRSAMGLGRQLMARKPDLILLLRQAPWGGLAPDARELFEERAAVMEYDGRLSRAEAERRAWQEVQLT